MTMRHLLEDARSWLHQAYGRGSPTTGFNLVACGASVRIEWAFSPQGLAEGFGAFRARTAKLAAGGWPGVFVFLALARDETHSESLAAALREDCLPPNLALGILVPDGPKNFRLYEWRADPDIPASAVAPLL